MIPHVCQHSPSRRARVNSHHDINNVTNAAYLNEVSWCLSAVTRTSPKFKRCTVCDSCNAATQAPGPVSARRLLESYEDAWSIASDNSHPCLHSSSTHPTYPEYPNITATGPFKQSLMIINSFSDLIGYGQV